MKVGVRPWQGYDRAVQHTLAYVGRYFLAGLIPAILFSMVLPGMHHAPYAPMLIHIGSVPILFPRAFLVIFAGLRMDSSRSWRRQPGRAWQAGILSVIAVWGGIVICTASGVRPPRFLADLVGREEAWMLHHCGLALLVVWIAPPRGEG